MCAYWEHMLGLTCWLDLENAVSPFLSYWIWQILTDLSSADEELQIWQSMWQKTVTRDFVESPLVHNLLISDYFCQPPLFSRFTIHFAPILYLFQGRSIGNKTWEHFHINNSHVGDVAVPCVTEMRKLLLMSKWRGDWWMKFSALTHNQLR